MAGIVDFDYEIFDFESLINWPEDNVETTDASSLQSPAADPLAASLSDISQSGLGLVADLGFDPLTTDFPLYDNAYLSPSPTVNYAFAASPQDFRPAVENLASCDSRSRSLKQKRRDAAIDLHLQRGNNALFYPCLLPTDAAVSLYTPSVSYSPESLQESFADQSRSATASSSHATPGSSSGRSEPLSDGPPSGNLELVLDLNMNAATQLPKKQRKRTKAEIDDYTNVRRNGACIKHKKQHKKCNCLDKVASPGITKPKTKNQKLARRSPVHETNFQTVKQSPVALQTTSPQSHFLSSTDGLGWFNSSDSGNPDYQNTQWSLLEESLLQDTLALQERQLSCLQPHCGFQAHSVQELNNHYNVHPNLRRTTSPQEIQTSVRDHCIEQPTSQPLMQTQPLHTSAINLPLDTRSAVSLSSSSSQPCSSASSAASSQELDASSHAVLDQSIASSSSRGVDGVFPPPRKVRRDPGGRQLVSSVKDDAPSVTHGHPAEMPLEISSFKRAWAVDGLLHDRGSVTNIIQPLEQPVFDTIRLLDKDHRPQDMGSPANVHLRVERSLAWQTSVNTGTMESYLGSYQLTPADFGAALTMIAATQMLLAAFNSAVRTMHSLSVVSQHLLSFTSSSLPWREGPYRGAIPQMV
ncbi:hypothetical protein PISL3812_05184 [Talaromyces islandicus]|uniref:Uncharacterized protein n=1 Tax=Talaromyces islandicus TaxID=28573 RepID=A0A0U1LXR0_TALIS|nr:hypothetical protein PISL3812_05184 [Talaromyces islandicus]